MEENKDIYITESFQDIPPGGTNIRHDDIKGRIAHISRQSNEIRVEIMKDLQKCMLQLVMSSKECNYKEVRNIDTILGVYMFEINELRFIDEAKILMMGIPVLKPIPVVSTVPLRRSKRLPPRPPPRPSGKPR